MPDDWYQYKVLNLLLHDQSVVLIDHQFDAAHSIVQCGQQPIYELKNRIVYPIPLIVDLSEQQDCQLQLNIQRPLQENEPIPAIHYLESVDSTLIQVLSQADKLFEDRQSEDAVKLLDGNANNWEANPELAVQRLIRLGYLYFDLGRFEELAKIINALNSTQSQFIDTRIHPFWLQAELEFSHGRYSNALPIYQQLNAMLAESQHHSMRLYTLTKIGFAHILLKQERNDSTFMDMGLSQLADAKELALQLQLPQFLPQIYTGIATYYHLTGLEPELKVQYLAKAENLQQELLGIAELAATKNNLAIAQKSAGQLADAHKSMGESYALINGHNNDHDKASISVNLANLYAALGLWEYAKRHYLSALLYQEEISDRPAKAKTLFQLGRLALHSFTFADAIEYVTQSLDTHTASNPLEQQSRLLTLSLAHAKNAEFVEAQNMLEQGSLTQCKSDIEHECIEARLLLAEIYLVVNQLEQAKAVLAEIDTAYINNVSQQLTYHQLNITQLRLSGHNNANKQVLKGEIEQHFSNAMELITKQQSTFDLTYIGPKWISSKKSLLDSYLAYLLETKNSQEYEQAFLLVENFQSSLINQRRQFFQNTNNENNLLPSSDLLHKQLAMELAIKDSANRELEDDIRLQGLSLQEKLIQTASVYSASKIATEMMSLADYQSTIANDEALLRYFYSNGQYYVFWLSKKTFGLKPLGNLDFLQKEMINPTSVNQAKAQINAESLLPNEIFNAKDISKLIIVPDHELHRLSFSDLKLPQKNATSSYLVQKFQIFRAITAQTYFQHEPTSDFRGSALTIFADPKFDAQLIDEEFPLPRLNWSNKAAHNIAKGFINTRVLTGDRATSEALLSEDSRSSQILHIASHAYYDQRHPDVVGIYTAATQSEKNRMPGFLSLTELLSKPIYSDLVIISACQTQLGEISASEGALGLAKGMLAQGAGAVIGTLWKVADKPTAMLMEFFYEELEKNQGNLALALQQAQSRLAKVRRYRSPYYWAGFVLTVSNRQYQNLSL